MPEIGQKDRLAFNKLLHSIATQEALVRGAESRLNILQTKASRDPENYGSYRDEAVSALQEEQEKLDELNDQRDNWGQDLEGTRPTLSDKLGNYAPNAPVARAGGIHIEGSNSNVDSGEQAQDPEEAGSDPIVQETQVAAQGGGSMTMREAVNAQTSEADDEETETKPSRKRGSKARSRRAASEEGSGDEE